MNDTELPWVGPRSVPDMDSRYMGMAWMSAAFSKDPNTQVGAFIVDADNKPLGWGYNGPPSTIDDESFNWARPTPDCNLEICKHDLVIHAEENAIEHSTCVSLVDATIYVTAHPCVNCMLRLVRKGIKRVVFSEFTSDQGSILRGVSRQKSEIIAKMSTYGIVVEEFDGDLTWMEDWIEKMKSLGMMERYKKATQ